MQKKRRPKPIRCGEWDAHYVSYCRVAHRGYVVYSSTFDYVGFRCTRKDNEKQKRV